MADNYVKGILTTGAGDYGLVQSISWAGEADEDTAKDESGDTVYYDAFDARVNATVTVRFDRDASLPETDDEVTLANCVNSDYDGAYYVTAPPNVDEANVEGPTATLNLRRYLDGAIPAGT